MRAERIGELPRRLTYDVGVEAARLPREPFDRARDGDGCDDLSRRITDGSRDRGDTSFSFPDRLRPATASNRGEHRCREASLTQAVQESVVILPRDEHLSSRSGLHGQLSSHGDRVS